MDKAWRTALKQRQQEPDRPGSVKTSLRSSVSTLQAWMKEAALPLWGTAGFDQNAGRFEERLTWSLERFEPTEIRLVSQARQIFVYSHAGARHMYADADDLAASAFESMVRDYYQRDGDGGWVFAIDRNGKVIDRRRDFYGHAFVLLAASAIYENSRNARALELANATLEFMDQYLVGPDVQGYAESLPPRPSLRRQNPHMHLFEGLLALWETSGDDTYLSRASSMFDLFATRFFDSTRGVVTEYFDDDLSPASPPEGLIVEPGHLYEWMWLLRRYQYAKGQDCQTYVDALYRSAISLGFDSNRRILSEVLVDGTPHSSQRRVWQVTEAIRANVVEALHGRKMAVDEAGHLVTTLQADFLQPAPFGGWIDRIDCDGKPADSYMPATAFYHLAGAILDVHDLLS